MKFLHLILSACVIILFAQNIYAEDPIHIAIEKHHCEITASTPKDENVVEEALEFAAEEVESIIIDPVIEEGKEVGGYLLEVEENWMDKIKSFLEPYQYIIVIVVLVLIVKFMCCVLCCECKRLKSWKNVKNEVRKKLSADV